MKTLTLIGVALSVATLVLIDSISNPAFTNRSGPSGGRTGSPGDGGATCALSGCHTGNAVVNTPGIITSNVPISGYIGGTTYTITAACSNGGSRFGFQISPQSSTGILRGSLVVTDATQTQIVSTKYIEHRNAGTSTTTVGSKSWSFNWVAPTSGTGAVTFYGSFNYANNDNSRSGDVIHTSTLVIPENTTGIFDRADNTESHFDMFPNPVANDNGSIVFTSHKSGRAIAELFDMTGKLVMTLFDRDQVEGQVSENINFNHTTPGIYFIRLTTADGSGTKKIILQ